MYSVIKKILFCFDPETAHHLSMNAIHWAGKLNLLKLFRGPIKSDPITVMGLTFDNPVGLAAGLDKDGDYFNGLGQLGFGFIEIGTVTPLAQAGNPKNRLFRLKGEEAIINRMGFNNYGVKHLVNNVKARKYNGILGINIGKNKATPEEDALLDYQICMDAVYAYADYITINVSSPNTPGLRNLQFGESFRDLLTGVKAKQAELHARHNKYVPVLVKIAPDMSDEELRSVAKCLLEFKIDGVVATNTTISREGVEQSVHKDETGGLSGAPVKDKSTATIRKLNDYLNKEIPIMGVGGIMTGEDALEKILAGASLVQIYSGFIYSGPNLIRDACKEIKSYKDGSGISLG